MSRIVDVPEAEPEKDGDTRLSLVAPSIEQSPDRMCIRFGLPTTFPKGDVPVTFKRAQVSQRPALDFRLLKAPPRSGGKH